VLVLQAHAMSKPEILSRRTLSFSRLAIDDSMRLYSERLDDWIFESSDTLLVPRYNRDPETLVLAAPPPPYTGTFVTPFVKSSKDLTIG